MPLSNDQVALRGIPDQPMRWALDDDLSYEPPTVVISRHGGPQTVIVKQGFRTDLASIPRPLWGLLPPFGKYTAAAVIHDYLYQAHEGSRAQADSVFYHAMRELQVPYYKAEGMWAAVRIFGASAWRLGPTKGGIV